MSTEKRTVATLLTSSTQSLPHEVRARLTTLLLRGELDLESIADIRTSLGVDTPDALRISGEYEQLAQRLGRDAARGVMLGVCAASSEDGAPMLVWTAPDAPAAARRTAQVVADLVDHANHTLLVVGYSLTKAAAPFVGSMAAAARRGVSCSFVADRMEEKLATLVKLWPPDVGLPQLWTRPANPDDKQSALHAKFLVVDSRRLLLTSANLTYHGFHGNIEMGVLLEGSVAAEAEHLAREWGKAGLILRVGAPAA